MAVPVRRWRFRAGGEDYTVPQNPASMSGVFPAKSISARASTAGRPLLFQGATPPQAWSFAGSCRSPEHYEALRHWTYDITGRILITDHFGRDIECVLTEFSAEPKRSVNVYWRHDYTISGLVLSVSVPTVGTSP